MAKAPYRGKAWETARLQVLHRDGYQCQIKRDGCTHLATTADHINPAVEHGPAVPPLDQLRAACGHCNSALGAILGNQRRARKPSRRWL